MDMTDFLEVDGFEIFIGRFQGEYMISMEKHHREIAEQIIAHLKRWA